MNLLTKTFEEFSEDRCPQMAAALAFYTMLSLAPLLFLVVTIAGLVVGQQATQALNEQAQTLVGPSGAQELQELLKEANQPSGYTIANIVSILVLVFSATGLVAQLQASLNQAWDVEPDPQQGGIKSFLMKRVLSLAMILGIAFLLLISMLLTTALGAVGGWISDLLGVGVAARYAISEGSTFIIVTLLFAAMFKVLPDAKIAWKDVWIGALITALLFTIGKFLIGLYLGNKDMSSTYGQAGSLVLVLLWVYYSSMIFFFGAELTQVWIRRRGREIEPAEGAVRVVETKQHAREAPGPASRGRQERARGVGA